MVFSNPIPIFLKEWIPDLVSLNRCGTVKQGHSNIIARYLLHQ